MADLIVDRHQIFEKRFQSFKGVIKQYRIQQLRLINEKADKEQEYEINKIKNEAQGKDATSFKKIEDNIKISEKIFKSRKINQCRMNEMKVRFDMIQKIQEEVKKVLHKQLQNKASYRKLLKDLIMQGLIKMLEQNVEVRCLKQDVGIIKEIIPECQRQFGQICVVQTKIKITDHYYLSQADLGGIILTSFIGRIVCDNTLRARLSYCMQLLLPNIRQVLFYDSDKNLSERRKNKTIVEEQKKQNDHAQREELI